MRSRSPRRAGARPRRRPPRRGGSGRRYADVGRIVLAIAVEVDNDVSARGERGIDAAAERGHQAAGAAVSHDMVGPRRERDERCSVARAVVDDDHLDIAHMGAAERATTATPGHGRRLVERGDDDRELADPSADPADAERARRTSGRPRYSGRWTRSTFRTTSRRSTQASSKPRPPFTCPVAVTALRTSFPTPPIECRDRRPP